MAANYSERLICFLSLLVPPLELAYPPIPNHLITYLKIMETLMKNAVFCLALLCLFVACDKQDQPQPQSVEEAPFTLDIEPFLLPEANSAGKNGYGADTLFLELDVTPDSSMGVYSKSYNLAFPVPVDSLEKRRIIELQLIFNMPLVANSKLETTMTPCGIPVEVTVPGDYVQFIRIHFTGPGCLLLGTASSRSIKIQNVLPLPQGLILTGVGVLLLDDNLA